MRRHPPVGFASRVSQPPYFIHQSHHARTRASYATFECHRRHACLFVLVFSVRGTLLHVLLAALCPCRAPAILCTVRLYLNAFGFAVLCVLLRLAVRWYGGNPIKRQVIEDVLKPRVELYRLKLKLTRKNGASAQMDYSKGCTVCILSWVTQRVACLDGC